MSNWKVVAKSFVTVLVAVVMIVLGVSSVANRVVADEPMSSLEGHGASPTPESFDPQAIALLIQDYDPWYGQNVHDALSELGVHHDIINSVHLATCDLSKYWFIMYASAQDDNYYLNLRDSLGKISAFVSKGRLLIAHCCDAGWDGTGSWQGFSILPGSVTHLMVWDDYKYSSQSIHIAEPEHGVVKSDQFTLTDEYLGGWGLSTHGIFTNLVLGTTVVMASNEGDGGDGPTYIDYDYGAGKVLATMQTVEWGYFNGSIAWVGDRPEFLRNEIRFALNWRGAQKSALLEIPATIRVLRTTGDAAGKIETVSFKDYVRNVLPNEWIPSWNTNALKAGAMAVKTYAWYRILHPKYPGKGYDVRDDEGDQVYKPGSSNRKTDVAIDQTWHWVMTKNGLIFESQYDSGTPGLPDPLYPGRMSQYGTEYWAQNGKDWKWMLHYYYDPVELTPCR